MVSRAASLIVLGLPVLLSSLAIRPPESSSAAESHPAAITPPPAANSRPGPPHPPLRLVEIEISRLSDLLTLHQLGFDVLERDSNSARVTATDADIAHLESQGFRMSVLELDLESATRRRLGPDGASYHTFDEVVGELDRLRAARPDLVGPRIAIGKSWEGRPLWAVKISDHPELDENEPEVLFDALHHAREPIGMETLLYAMNYLVRYYDRDPEIRALVDEREIWFVPVVNPDGYVWGGMGGMWRKNRRPNADGSFGVDLNRNYGYQWGYDDLGSSPLPSSQTYRGPSPFSEPETSAMRDFILGHRFVTGMTLHAYSEINLLPCGWTDVRPPEAEAYEEIAHDLEEITGYPHGQPSEILYVSNGRTQDWQSHEAGMVAIEPEIGPVSDGFWPAASRIPVLAEQNLPGILYMARLAGASLAAAGIEVDDSSVAAALVLARAGERLPPVAGDGDGLADPGETVDLIVTLANKGFADAKDVVMRVTSPSPFIQVHGKKQVVGNVCARSRERLDAHRVRVSVAAGAPLGESVPVVLDLTGRGLVTHATVELTLGTPSLVFADDAESGLARWTTTQGWGLVPVPGGYAFSDSPHGSYRSNADNSLVLNRSLDLSTARRVELRYRETVATEPWDDLCRVEARIPGKDWRPVLTLPGGIESRFRERRLSLDAFAGEPNVALRFRLTSNHSNQRDGWTIDDIQVWAYGGADSSVALATPATPAKSEAGARPPTQPGSSVAE